MKMVDASVSLIKETDPFKKIEVVGRTCYKSSSAMTEETARKFYRQLVNSKHTAMVEHATFVFEIDEETYLRCSLQKFLNCTETYFEADQSRYLVSGNLRAINEALLGELLSPLYKLDPDLVYIGFDYNLEAFENMAVLTSLDNYCDLTEEEINTHTYYSVHFICDRGVTHEIVRHRPASFAQESTRYCVAGDTLLSTKNPHYKLTIKDLYDNIQNSNNGSYKRILIKQLNENNGELTYSKIKRVMYNGVKPTIKLKTLLGYELECTIDHEIYTPSGYIKAGDLSIKDYVYINGITVNTLELYKNKDWLYHQNITLNKTFVQIAEEFNFNVSTLKKWARKLEIPKKGTGYFNVGREPWNKGLNEDDDDRVKNQANALREFHYDNSKKGVKIMKEDTSEYWKHMKTECEICGCIDNLEVHHKDFNRSNSYPKNLLTVCESCHQRVHNHSLEITYADEIVSIEDIGSQDVYDIEMDSKDHNFIANGIVVHNCNYSKDKFGEEITVIKPLWFDDSTVEVQSFFQFACCVSEQQYFNVLRNGWTPEQARSVLPNSLKTELIMTANLKEWKHFFNLRYFGTTGAPHPQAKEVAEMAYNLIMEV